MKIYSKFRDYYDSVLKISQTEEDGVVYQRDTDEIIFNLNQAEVKEFGYTRHFRDEFIKFIGFCGKIYPFVFFDFAEEEYSTKKAYYVGADDSILFESLTKHNSKMSRHRWLDNITLYEINYLFGVKQTDTWWQRYEFVTPFKLEEFFIRYETPIFLFEQLGYGGIHNSQNLWKLTKNVCLQDFQFQKIVDPFTAFQEISMFFNTTLTNLKTPVMPVGDDKTLAESKGFDKWSFRKMGKDSK